MSKRFLIILAVLVAGFAGFIIFQGKKDTPNSTNNSSSSAGSEHKQGAGNKSVTLVEYGDFQCPSCASYYAIIKEVKDKYKDDITFQFKHFPLTQIHNNAMAAHRAAEASGKQNKFWEMHDLLYERQTIWGTNQNVVQIMEDYATELGLNVEQFKSDYQSSSVNDIINSDISSGNSFQITGTPSFLLNGEKIDNPEQSIDAFSKIIDEAIAKSQNSAQ
jgi:protein-disulfide isomerase